MIRDQFFSSQPLRPGLILLFMLVEAGATLWILWLGASKLTTTLLLLHALLAYVWVFCLVHMTSLGEANVHSRPDRVSALVPLVLLTGIVLMILFVQLLAGNPL